MAAFAAVTGNDLGHPPSPKDILIVQKVHIATQTGWTFAYIESLSIQEMSDLFAVWDGIHRGEKFRAGKRGK